MFGRLFSTRSDSVLTIVRLVVEIVFFAHGAERVFGWFGDGGFEGTMIFTDMTHIPLLLGFGVIIAGILWRSELIIGLLGRVSAFGI